MLNSKNCAVSSCLNGRYLVRTNWNNQDWVCKIKNIIETSLWVLLQSFWNSIQSPSNHLKTTCIFVSKYKSLVIIFIIIEHNLSVEARCFSALVSLSNCKINIKESLKARVMKSWRWMAALIELYWADVSNQHNRTITSLLWVSSHRNPLPEVKGFD